MKHKYKITSRQASDELWKHDRSILFCFDCEFVETASVV